MRVASRRRAASAASEVGWGGFAGPGPEGTILCAVALLSLACGGDVRYRSLVLDIQGLSARAVELTVMLFPGSDAPVCADLILEQVPSLTSPMTRTWTRATDEERSLVFDSILEDRVVVVAYSEDETGAPIQLGCVEIDYLDLESPEASVRLSARASP